MKKSFTDNNPALDFISGTQADEEAAQVEAATTEEQTTAKETPTAPPPKKIEENGIRYYLDPRYLERKTKRVQLVFQPSVFEAAKARAEAKGMSLNSYLHELIIKDCMIGE